MGECVQQDELLILLKRQDNRAYQYLYRHYFFALKSLAFYYVKNDQVAEDLVQEVFISLLDADFKFAHIDEVKYFLYSSLKNKCISYFRKQKVRDKYAREAFLTAKEEGVFWDKVMEEDVYASLMAAIGTLPPQCKLVIVMTLEGMKIAEIAEHLHIAEKTVKDHKKNGKKKLLALLKNRELILMVNLLILD